MASLQPAMIEGNAGGLEAVVGSLAAMNGSTLLPGPALAVPVAVDLVMVPTESGEKLTNWALAPAKPPIALLVAPAALPDAVEESMLPKFAPTKPPMMSLLPVPVTLPDAVDCSIEPRLVPAKPPR